MWSIAKSANSVSAHRFTDAITIELPATLLGRYGSFLSVAQEPWLCEIDPSLESLKLYGFSDDTGDDLEIDRHYPAVLALGVDNGIISTPPTDMVQSSCDSTQRTTDQHTDTSSPTTRHRRYT